jgi:Ca2+-binding EF-hand superfamily protein
MKLMIATVVFTLAACAPHPVKRQMVGLLEKFDRWDYNGDGSLSLSELNDAERLSGVPAAEIVSFYDTDKDGKISFREAQSGMSREDEARNAVGRLQTRP